MEKTLSPSIKRYIIGSSKKASINQLLSGSKRYEYTINKERIIFRIIENLFLLRKIISLPYEILFVDPSTLGRIYPKTAMWAKMKLTISAIIEIIKGFIEDFIISSIEINSSPFNPNKAQ